MHRTTVFPGEALPFIDECIPLNFVDLTFHQPLDPNSLAPFLTESILWCLNRNPRLIMAYTDDAVKAKLSALNETQESIVTVSQWIMFHRRHADRTATIWLQKLKEAGSSKRLNLIYLVNGIRAPQKPQSGSRGSKLMILCYRGCPTVQSSKER